MFQFHFSTQGRIILFLSRVSQFKDRSASTDGAGILCSHISHRKTIYSAHFHISVRTNTWRPSVTLWPSTMKAAILLAFLHGVRQLMGSQFDSLLGHPSRFPWPTPAARSRQTENPAALRGVERALPALGRAGVATWGGWATSPRLWEGQTPTSEMHPGRLR